TIDPNQTTVLDDAIAGTVNGHTIELERDSAAKPSITLAPPGDRPYRAYLNDLLIPAAQEDRESYSSAKVTPMKTFLHSCQLYKSGSWQRKFIKGATAAERNANFDKIIYALSGQKVTPHTITRNYRFYSAVNDNLKDPSLAGLAMSTFGMY